MGWQSLCCDLQVRHRNALLFSVMVLLWGLNWSIMKIGLRISPPFAFTSHRLLLSSMFLLALGIVFKPRIQIDSKTVSRLFVYSLVSIPSFASTIPGLHLQSSGIGAVLTYTQPIMVSIMAVTFLNESFSVLRFVGTLLGFSGVADLFLEDTGSILSWASLLLLIGAFLWGGWNNLLQGQPAKHGGIIRQPVPSIYSVSHNVCVESFNRTCIPGLGLGILGNTCVQWDWSFRDWNDNLVVSFER